MSYDKFPDLLPREEPGRPLKHVSPDFNEKLMARINADRRRRRLRKRVAVALAAAAGLALFYLAVGRFLLRLPPRGGVVTPRTNVATSAPTPAPPRGEASLRVAVHPPKDPEGKRWLVEVSGPKEAKPEAHAEANASGVADIPAVPAGDVQATVRNYRGTVFARREIALVGNRRAAIEVPLVTVRGKVVLNEAPFPSYLWFGKGNGRDSVMLTTNEDGTFEGSLPSGGDWTVQVVGRPPSFVSVVGVTVGPDELTIRVPDTTLNGVVVDPNGGPLDQINVFATAAHRPFSTRTNPDGTFTFRALLEGPVTVEAEDPRTQRRSKKVETTLKGGEPANIRLSF
jgi:hypothetical protein